MTSCATLTPNQAKLLTEAKARLASGVIYPSADAYYADKDTVRKLEAKELGMTPGQYDPVGHWYGRQSN